VAIALIVVFALKLAVHRIRLRRSPVNKFVVFYIYTALFSAINLFNAERVQFVDFGTKAAQLLLVTTTFFVISSLPLSERELKNLLRTWFLIAFVVAAYAVYQLPARSYGWPFAYLALSNPSVAPGGVQTGRAFEFTASGVRTGRRLRAIEYAQVSGFFREPTWLGSYLLSALVLFGVLILSGKGRAVLFRSSRLNRFFLSVLVLGLLLPVALGPYVSFAMTLGLMYMLRRSYRPKIIKLVLLLLILLLLGGLLASAAGIDLLRAISARVGQLLSAIAQGSTEGTSLSVRLQRTLAALKVWASHPLLGVGLNNTQFYTHGVMLTNNGWARLLSDQGMIGFIAMALVLWSLLWGLNRLLWIITPSSWWHCLVVGFIFVLISDAIDTAITFNWTHPLRWFDLAMANLVYIQAGLRFTPRHLHESAERRRAFDFKGRGRF